jgi:hypothetical protein
MRIGASLVLIALGAILRFTITPQQSHGVNWGTIGIILMVVGLVGALITIALMTTRRRTDVIVQDDRPNYGAPAGPAYGVPLQARSTTYVEPLTVDPRK